MGYFVEVTGKAGVKTRYLHLNKILVTKEATGAPQKHHCVNGNSGRSSGPHLHYELVINNNPVNSLSFRASAPADNKLEQHAFAHVRDYERYLD
jgi:murein DD-endopeptidase MepM/ murein hydrolase activator NlpD